MAIDKWFSTHYHVTTVQQELNHIPDCGSIKAEDIRKALNDHNTRGIQPDTPFSTAWCAAFDREEFHDIPNFERAFMLLRWPDDKPLLEVFQRMGSYAAGQPKRRPKMFQGYIRLFYSLCALIEPIGIVSAKLCCTSRDEMVVILRENASQYMKAWVSRFFYQFGHQGPWAGYVITWRDWSVITKHEVGYVVQKKKRERQAFTWEELQRLFQVAEQDARDNALLRFYIHTACRNSAARELLLANVYDARSGEMRDTGVVLEKFGRDQSFPIDDVLAKALKRWIQESGVTVYVFPSPLDVNHKWTYQNGPGKWLVKLCTKASIFGSHIYVHGLRHTVATLLHKAGNKVEDISSILGHRSVDTTQIYIDRSISRPQDHMLIPWLPSDNIAGLRLSVQTISDVIEQTTGNTTGGSSSSSSSSSGELDIQANEMTMRLVKALSEKVATLESNLEANTKEYNFMITLYSPAQLHQLGEWQQKHRSVDNAAAWKTVLHTYQTDYISESDDQSDGSDC